jgi:gamma-glutamylcyclotransferase (GGCT)/AIG2-like uncharacterized protein YtfP
MSLIFVYGTLMRNQRNHWRLFDSKFIGRAAVHGELFQFPLLNFPILRRHESRLAHGELYEVSHLTLATNDVEEVWYRRVKTLAYPDYGQNLGLAGISCWVYEGLDFLPLRSAARKLPGGGWPWLRA